MPTGFVWDERYAWHQQGLMPLGSNTEPFPGPDTPETKRRIYSLVQTSGLGEFLVPLKPRLASEEEIGRFHTVDHIERVKQVSAAGGGPVGETTSIGEGGYEIAALAAGGCLVAVDAVLEGTVDNAYALVRPAGHHAEAGQGRGFCVFGNTALAALHAKHTHDIARIAIIDWDVHHGNGTEDAFYGDHSVLTISIHQDGNYPIDRGQVEAVDSPAKGANINIPLPPGSGHGAYVAAIVQVVLPALQAFRPELIMIASGVDASARDPLGRMLCSAETYRRMTELLMSVAKNLCSGRVVACHEGGYAPTHAPFCTLAIMEVLSGYRTRVVDPMAERLRQSPGHELLSEQQSVISQAAARLPS